MQIPVGAQGLDVLQVEEVVPCLLWRGVALLIVALGEVAQRCGRNAHVGNAETSMGDKVEQLMWLAPALP